jgi:ABC-type multidrug transport system fused ATPase/permease subunit
MNETNAETKSGNIIYYLLAEFLKENKMYLLFLIIISLAVGVLQTNGISILTASLIDSLQKKEKGIWTIFQMLCGMYVLFHALEYMHVEVNTRLVIKMQQWARFKLLEMIMRVNNDIFSDSNFTKLNSPIHRISDLAASIISDILAYMLPNLIFVIVIGIHFLLLSPLLSLIFLAGNILILSFYFYTFEYTLAQNKAYEDEQQETDGLLIDLLSNMDKIVYRGKVKDESDNFEDVADKNVRLAMEYYTESNKISSVMSLIILIVFLISLGYLVYMASNKEISHVTFISSLTILILFHEKLNALISQLPSFVGYVGRMTISLKYFEHVNIHFEKVLENNRFTLTEIPFKKIKFDNVSYKYSSGNYVFQNKTIETTLTDNKIIGITGPSGAGKSTFIKLLIKMYPCEEGNIYIDGVNITELDPLYIRSNITYVNQTSKLFDKKVIENMMYGCHNKEKCEMLLKKIMNYPTIFKLYKNMDIYTKDSGLLGENLSGGQRQVVNMIGGFINPSKILILDEPTNALDPILKKEVIQMISDFKEFKQSILIITHDKDVFSIFDSEVKIQ